jgi:uncharacterized membrane protein YgcG
LVALLSCATMPARRQGSLKNLDMLGDLMKEVSAMLDKSLTERDRALDHVGRSLAAYEAEDSVLRAELADLPPELDAYLRLVRDKRKMEARRQALEAQSISHSLNFHLGGGENAGVVWGGAGPSIMDELRAEEEELDRQAQEDAEFDEKAMKKHLDWEANMGGDDGGNGGGGGVRKKKKKKQRQKPIDSFAAPSKPLRAEKVAEEEAYNRFNMRDGLFAHLDDANDQEAELEAKVEQCPEGSIARLDAESELARFRQRRSDEVAEFFSGYNPQRVQRGKEEPLAGLGLSHILEDPAEVVAGVERRHFESAALAEGMTLSDLGLSPSGGVGGGGHEGQQSPHSGGSFGGGSFGGGGGGAFAGEGGGASPAMWGAPRPHSRGGLSPTEGGGGGRPASSGGGNRMMPPTSHEGGGGGGGGGGRRTIPGVGVAQKLSDQTVTDPYMGRGILDLPSYGTTSVGEQAAATSSSDPNNNDGGGGAFDDIRGTVKDNTNPMDLSFPTLEFRRRKQQDRNATYFTPGEAPEPYFVAQTEGAVWSSMARERREIEAEERRSSLEALQWPGGGSGGGGSGGGRGSPPPRQGVQRGTRKKKKGSKKKSPAGGGGAQEGGGTQAAGHSAHEDDSSYGSGNGGS